MKVNGNEEFAGAIMSKSGDGSTHTHAPRVLDRRDSEKVHDLVMTHGESLTRFDTSRLGGWRPPTWTHQRASLGFCGAIEATGDQQSDRPYGNIHLSGNLSPTPKNVTSYAQDAVVPSSMMNNNQYLFIPLPICSLR
jgi:hypothetical protein